MLGYSVDDIVWVNLGLSYGWWPAQVQDRSGLALLSQNILHSLGPEFCEPPQSVPGQGGLLVRFFDDDTKEWLGISERKRLKKYSCKDKRKLITAGFRKLDESKRSNALGGVNLRLAQFYKDVELAEVLTDNDPQVASLLAEYEVRESEEPEDQQQHQPEVSLGPNEEGKGEKSRGMKNSVLREIKNARVGKQSKRGRRKKR